MKPVLTPDEMEEADRRTIAAGTPAAVLMERAGRAVARTARHLLGGSYGRRAVIVCGKGNNGGDGLVVDRVLRGWGVRTTVFLLADGIDSVALARELERTDISVDAMFGTGFRGALEGDAARAVEALRVAPLTVAVDIPSGVDGSTGAVAGPAVVADHTVTFAALKPGLVCEPGRAHAGEVTVADIGLDLGIDALATPFGVPEDADVVGWLPIRATDVNKWSAGGLYVVGGSAGMTGAPMLVSRAALRAGAGIVWCGMPGEEAAALASGGEVITKALPATPHGSLADPGAIRVLRDLERFAAVVVGPGLGRDAATAVEVAKIVAEAPVPLVLDADGLTGLHGDLSVVRARLAAGLPLPVLTPHEGEYERVAGERAGTDRIGAARRLADVAHAIVLLKGPGTVVAEPSGRACVNATGGPQLATAGTGDVLAGVVGALLARGVPPFEAAAAAAYLHGRAAEVAPHPGMVAGDLLDALPGVLGRLGESGVGSGTVSPHAQ